MENDTCKRVLKISEMHLELIEDGFCNYLQREDSILWGEIKDQIKNYLYQVTYISDIQKDHIYELLKKTHKIDSLEDLEEALTCRISMVNNKVDATNIHLLTLEEADELIKYLEKEYWDKANDVIIIKTQNN